MSKVDAARFVLQCQNWPEVAIPIATHRMPSRVILKNGTRFESDAVYWADMYAIFFQHIYTPHYLPIEENDIVVDIGANIGVFTVYAASKTRNTVYAIEPYPHNFDAMSQNVEINQLRNVVPLRLAISDTNGTEMFLASGQSQHHRLQKITFKMLYQESENAQYIEVPSMTLQDFMDRHQLGQIDFLKLDCEGSEESIFQSTPQAYLRRIRKIALEFHDHLTHTKHQELQKFLEHAGFFTQIHWDGKSMLGFIYAWRN